MIDYELRQKGRWINISPKPTGLLLKRLTEELSYMKKGGQFMPNPQWAMVKLYQPGRARFPIGLLQRSTKVFQELRLNYKITHHIDNSVCEFGIKDKGLRPYQLAAIRKMQINFGGILSIPTGGGKTRIATAFINWFNKPTLVVVPTIDLKIQWEDRVDSSVEIRTYQSLKSKSYLQKFELVIFDECHMVAAKTLQLIGMNLNESTTVYGLSATPYMRDDDNLKVEGVSGPIIYHITIKELIGDKYLVDAKIHYIPVSNYENCFSSYTDLYQDYIVDNKERNKLILDTVEKHNKDVLILVDRIDHGKILEKMLKDYNVRFIHGNSKDRADNNYNILIATSIYDQGIDIPRLKTLILAGGGKSSIKTTQRIGRVLRKHPKKKTAMVFDFVDNCKYLHNHYKKRREIFEENFEVVDV